MLNKICLATWICILGILPSASYSQQEVILDDSIGQVIQISTRLDYFIGIPSWLIIIRDVDHGINIPYLFDFNQPNNFWIAFTYGHDYIITASKLTIVKYEERFNAYRKVVINDFCNLQSNGRIHHGKSMSVVVTGALTPARGTYSCHVTSYPDGFFTVVQP